METIHMLIYGLRFRTPARARERSRARKSSRCKGRDYVLIATMVLFFLFLKTETAVGENGSGVFSEERPTEFPVPAKLRGRVDFWKRIFTEYGKNQIVIHHRMYPQAIFGVIDLNDDVKGLNPIERDVVAKRVEQQVISNLKKVFYDLSNDDDPKTELEERIVKEMKKVSGTGNKYKRALEEDLIRTQTGMKEKFAQAIERSGEYMPIMEKIFASYGLPVELTRLPFVESSFDYDAVSSVGALGLWQFMKGTAKGYMTVNNLIDQRKDPIASTHAAARYFLSAKNRLGDWGFAITSYNHGIAGVAKKMSEVEVNDISSMIEHPTTRVLGFASNNFYPSFLAAVETYRNRGTYFPHAKPYNQIKYKEVTIHNSIPIRTAAERFGVSLSTLQIYNRALSSYIWNGYYKVPAGISLRVPIEKGLKYESEEVLHTGFQDRYHAPVVKKKPGVISQVIKKDPYIYHKVKKGENLSIIAGKYHTSVEKIKRLNKIKKNIVVAGVVLKIPK